MENRERKKRLEMELRRVTHILAHDYGAQKIFLFGSLASGHVHEWSDLDLVVIKQTNKRFLDRISEVLELTSPKVGCDIIVYTPTEFDQMASTGNSFIRDEIGSRGKVLYDQAA